MEKVITVEGLSKTYRSGFWMRKVRALKGVDFHVVSGRITGFVGANGAGKTTTLRCLLNFTKFHSGHISFFGNKTLSAPLRRRIGYMPEQPNFYDHLSGIEFLKFHGGLSGVSLSRVQILRHLDRVHLAFAADRRLREYSKGMLQRIGILQAMIHKPDLLILDEPMSGLDPDGRKLVKDLLRQVAEEGVSLFFSTHLLEDVEDLSRDVVMMAQGQVKYFGDLQQVLYGKQRRFKAKIDQGGKVSDHIFDSEADLDQNLKKWLDAKVRIIELAPVRKKLEEVYAEFSQGIGQGIVR